MMCVKADSLMCGVALVAAIICVLIEDSGAADTNNPQAGPSRRAARGSKGKKPKLTFVVDTPADIAKQLERSDDSKHSDGKRRKLNAAKEEVPDMPDYGTSDHFNLFKDAARSEDRSQDFGHHGHYFNPFSGYSNGDFHWDANTVETDDKTKMDFWVSNVKRQNLLEYDDRKRALEYLILLICTVAEWKDPSKAILYFLSGALQGYSFAHQTAHPPTGHRAVGTGKEPFVQEIALEFVRKHGAALYYIIPPELEARFKIEINKLSNLPDYVNSPITTIRGNLQLLVPVKHVVDKATFLKRSLDEMRQQFDKPLNVREHVPLEELKTIMKEEVMKLFHLFMEFGLYQACAKPEQKVLLVEIEELVKPVQKALLTGSWLSHGFSEDAVQVGVDLYFQLYDRQVTVIDFPKHCKELIDLIRSTNEWAKGDSQALREGATYLALNTLLFEGDIRLFLTKFCTSVMLHALRHPSIVLEIYYTRITGAFNQLKGMYKDGFIKLPMALKTIFAAIARATYEENNKKENSKTIPYKKFQSVLDQDRNDAKVYFEVKPITLPAVMEIVKGLLAIAVQIALGAIPNNSTYKRDIEDLITFLGEHCEKL